MAKKLIIVCILFGSYVPVFAEVHLSWKKEYKASESGVNRAEAIAVDDSGNVYITGSSWTPGTQEDYTTIKYYPDGDLAWIRQYNGPVDSIDKATAITVDGCQNVYVTGYSCGQNLSQDYLTIKYDSDGNELWLARYDGPKSRNDHASALAVDEDGNVYVTGWSTAEETASDYTTIRYDSTGKLLWTRRYDGISREAVDRALALALDPVGDIIVTGESDGLSSEPIDIDWDTIYLQLWFVTPDYATIKYDPLGNELWVERYDGTAQSWDGANAIVVDDSGNSYVTGSSHYQEGKYVPSGFATVKYHPNGEMAWVSRYDGQKCSEAAAEDVAVDLQGNVYVTARCSARGTGDDYLTIKYDKLGSQLWTASYNDPADHSDQPKAVRLDTSGNIYVAGTSYGSKNMLTIVKYNPDGQELWVHKTRGTFSDMAIDKAGDIYLATTRWYSHKYGSEYLTIKYKQTTPASSSKETSNKK